jgi:hypothetical protein
MTRLPRPYENSLAADDLSPLPPFASQQAIWLPTGLFPNIIVARRSAEADLAEAQAFTEHLSLQCVPLALKVRRLARSQAGTLRPGLVRYEPGCNVPCKRLQNVVTADFQSDRFLTTDMHSLAPQVEAATMIFRQMRPSNGRCCVVAVGGVSV